MKIRYTVVPEDIVMFNIRHLRQNAKFKKTQFKMRIVFAVVYAVVGVGLFLMNRAFWPFSWILIFLAILWAIFYPTVSELRIKRHILKLLKTRGDAGIHELSFENDGIAAKNDVKEGWIPWENVLKVIYCIDYLYLYITKDDAIIVPRKGLLDEKASDWEQICSDLADNAERKAIMVVAL